MDSLTLKSLKTPHSYLLWAGHWASPVNFLRDRDKRAARHSEKYWIIKVRVFIKKVQRFCVVLRKLYAGSIVKKMANLPAGRCRCFRKAFAVCGDDLLRTFSITVGRPGIKMYACTCSSFTSRAVHFEKFDDLTKDSFINWLIKFVALRGQVGRVFSDDGADMVGPVMS